MNCSIKKMWLSCMVASSLVVMATAAANEYLPPNKGYNYDKPNIPFPSNNNPSQQPKPTPAPYRPPQTPAPYRPSRPTYVPPQQPNQPQEHEHHEHQEHHEHHDEHDHHHHHEPGMPFDFSYNVNENGNDYSHNAISDGDVTTGEYRIALPDGRTQIVKYTADWKNGFNAEVTYEGEAQYPEPSSNYASSSGSQGYAPSTGGQAYAPESQGGGYQY